MAQTRQTNPRGTLRTREPFNPPLRVNPDGSVDPNDPRNTLGKLSRPDRLALSVPQEEDEEQSYDEAAAQLPENRAKMRRAFIRIFEPRMRSVLKEIEGLQPLADGTRYDFSPEMWAEARDAILDKVAETDDAYKSRKGRIGAFQFTARFRGE